MDPKILFQAICEHTAEVGGFLSHGEHDSAAELAVELAEEVINMHEWMLGGGFVPQGVSAGFRMTASGSAVDRARRIVERSERGFAPGSTTSCRFVKAVRTLI